MHRYHTDVVIHIDEELGDQDLYDIERDIGLLSGVYSACVNDQARHLMSIDYDPEDVQAADLLSRVRQHGVSAELIGL